MKKVSLVVFDMDGLLINSERGMWLVNERKTFTEMGYEIDEPYLINVIGSSMANYKKAVKEKYGDDFDFDKFYKLLDKYNEEMIQNKELTLMKGAKELLEFLKSNNIEMKIATSTPIETALNMLNSTGIVSYFKEVISGEQVKVGKPAPDIYLTATKNDNRDETLIFEDSHNGSRAAIASGIRLMLVPDLAKLTDEDRNEAFHVLKDLSEAIPIIKEINNIK